MKLLGVWRDPNRSVLRMRMSDGLLSVVPCHYIELHLCWFDFWVGWYWDSAKRVLYVCPLPMLAFRYQRRAIKR